MTKCYTYRLLKGQEYDFSVENHVFLGLFWSVLAIFVNIKPLKMLNMPILELINSRKAKYNQKNMILKLF